MRKVYPLDEVLSVSTGYLVAERHMEAVYDLIGHLTGDEGVTTLGLVAAAKTCEAELKRQFPDLEKVTVPWWDEKGARSPNSDEIRQWVREQKDLVGLDLFPVLGYVVYDRDYSFMQRMGSGR